MDGDLPKSVDWREKGAITPIKNQGKCGSCWAFTAIELIESYRYINEGILEPLSAQQIVDCVKNPYECGGKGGCDGAVVQMAFNYSELLGLVTEKRYPYEGKEFYCRTNWT